MSGPWAFWLTLIWFTLTYAGLGLGRIPGLRTDRAGVAWVGAALVLGCGLLSFDQAVAAIDFATLALLLGMMVVVGHLRIAGFFDRLARWALSRVGGPFGLLAATMTLSGVLSALLVNDVVCLALTPVVLRLARRLGVDPKPHLIGLALASNVGSAAALTGNPQNMIVGNKSEISYLRFAAKLAPVAVVGLGLAWLVVACVYRKLLRTPADGLVADLTPTDVPLSPGQSRLLVKSLAVTLATVALFFAGAPMAVVALGAGALLLLDRKNPSKVYQEIDWPLLVMFAGLFVVVRAFEVHVVRPWGLEENAILRNDPIGALSLASAGLSNLVSNVPAVLLFVPVVTAMPEGSRETAWLALAVSSTLAGNLTILGSVANLIVVEGARREGVNVTFWEYARAGIPVTVLTLAVAVAWLWIARY